MNGLYASLMTIFPYASCKDSGIFPNMIENEIWLFGISCLNLKNWIDGNGCWNDDFLIVQSLNVQFSQGNLLCFVTILDLIL
jgi:hypothetical protein